MAKTPKNFYQQKGMVKLYDSDGKPDKSKAGDNPFQLPTIQESSNAAEAVLLAARQLTANKANEKMLRQAATHAIEHAGHLMAGIGLGSLFPPSAVVTIAYALIRAWRMVEDVTTAVDLIKAFGQQSGILSLTGSKEPEYNQLNNTRDVETLTALGTIVFKSMILNSIADDKRTRPGDKYSWTSADTVWLSNQIYRVVDAAQSRNSSLYETWVLVAYDLGPALQETRPRAFNSIRMWYDQVQASNESLSYMVDSMVNVIDESPSVREATANLFIGGLTESSMYLAPVAIKIQAVESMIRDQKSLQNVMITVEKAGLSVADRQSSLMGMMLMRWHSDASTMKAMATIPVLPFGMTGYLPSTEKISEEYRSVPFNNPPPVNSAIHRFWLTTVQSNVDPTEPYNVSTKQTLTAIEQQKSDRANLVTMIANDRQNALKDIQTIKNAIKKLKGK